MNHNQALLAPPAETEAGVAPNTNSVADAYGMAEEMGKDPMHDMQLGPEDGLVRGEDGQLHSVAAEQSKPRVASVFDAAPEQGRYDQPTGQGAELAVNVPRQIAVRDLGAGATALQVSTGPGNIYRGQPVQSGGTLYGGKLVGERYQGTRRISG